jgi:DNA-binding CsgD family transcriptional regulator
MHKNINFYLNYSGASIITICMNDSDKVFMEHIFEVGKSFEHFMKEYVFNKKNFNRHSFVSNYKSLFKNNIKYYETKSLHDILQVELSKKESAYFTNNIQMKDAIIMPIVDIEFKKRIGYITFIFNSDNKNLEKIEELKNFFEILIQPLYDYKNNLIFSKCTRVDQHFKLLTPQERRVIKKILRGKSYIEIAETMDISINTIKSHVKSIFNKYSVRSKIELYNKIIEHIL